jgi:predicted Rossmann fold nucleotide-binding protein DprA/Smf involved in DNA uptake
MPDTIDDVRRLIQTRLTEIDAERKGLERAVAAMTEGSGPRAPRRRRSRSVETAGSLAPKPGRAEAPDPAPTKRAPRGRRREELLDAIEAEPGARPSKLAQSIGIRPTQVSVLLAKLRAERLIVKDGEGYARSPAR